MPTKYPACSQTGGERSNPQAEARCGEPVSRNKSELDSASLHVMEVTKLPELLKSDTAGEGMLMSSQRASRGDWRRRAGKEESRNLRGPAELRSNHRRESDGPIVVGKGLTRLERRGPTVNMQRLRHDATA